MIVDDIINGKVVPYDVTSVMLNVNDIPAPIFMTIASSINLSENENYSYFVCRPPTKYRFWDLIFWDLIDENGQRQEVDNDLSYNQNREFNNYNFDIEKLGLKPCFDEHGKVYAITVEFNLCLIL